MEIMKLRVYTLTILAILGVNLSQSQTRVPIEVDLRGRDCNGGRGICGISKISDPNTHISLEKTAVNTFILTMSRTDMTFIEEAGIAGKLLTEFQSVFPTIFIQNENFIFGNDVLKALGIDGKYNLLKKGNYPMSIDESEVKITLVLVKNGKT